MESGNLTMEPIDSTSRLPRWIVALTLTSCAFSVFGSSVQIITYHTCQQLRIPSRELLVYMSIGDLLSALALGVGTFNDFHETSHLCVAQAFFSTFFSMSAMFWLVALLIYLLVTVVTINPERSASLVFYFHTICWGVPALVSLLALSLKELGTTHSQVSVGWCWVKVHRPQSLFWMLITEKLWELATFLSLVIFSVGTSIQISRKRSNEDLDYLPFGTAEAMRKINTKVLFIPLIFLLLRVWGLVRFVLFIRNSPHAMNTTLMALQGIGNTGQGFVNLILFWFCTARTRATFFSGLSNITNVRCLKKLLSCQRCCLRSNSDSSKPLLREQSNWDNKKDFYVHFKGNVYDYPSSNSISQS